jgi:hypothetical protein
MGAGAHVARKKAEYARLKKSRGKGRKAKLKALREAGAAWSQTQRQNRRARRLEAAYEAGARPAKKKKRARRR